MQEIIIEKPYRFVPPHRGDWIPALIQKTKLVDRYLSRFEGIESFEVRHVERLKESLRAGHGILLAPNHCRYADPIALGWLAREAQVHIYSMASWHLFNQNWLQSLAIKLCGGFSVFREGVDRKSIDTAVEILTEAKRPLVLFPEGTVFRTNDLLNPLMEGVSFLARTAARRRAKAQLGRVVVHPVAIKYLFRGDLPATVEPVLQMIEERLTWADTMRSRNLVARVRCLEEALLSLKEVQFFGKAQAGSLADRKQALIARLMDPLEIELLGRPQGGNLLPRIKQLRALLVPHLTEPATSQEQRRVIWRQLADIYLAQQIESYPVGYLDHPTETRVLETVERFEEDLTDRARIHRPLHAILEVEPAIEVEATKPPKDQPDPITAQLEASLRSRLATLSKESAPVPCR